MASLFEGILGWQPLEPQVPLIEELSASSVLEGPIFPSLRS